MVSMRLLLIGMAIGIWLIAMGFELLKQGI